MFPILMGLAIGAAMGGGIAALRGGKTDDILKGALLGGGGGFQVEFEFVFALLHRFLESALRVVLRGD